MNDTKDKTHTFGIRVVKLCKYVEETKREFVLSNQLKRSGTAPGALIREAEHAESKKDFVHKLSIALKEAKEAKYWIDMLKTGGYISEIEFCSIDSDIEANIKILAAIVKKLKN